MLKLTLHAGDLVDVSPYNCIGSLEIAYARNVPGVAAVAADKTGATRVAAEQFLADYMTVAFVYGLGETALATLERYPRWASSLWDLVVRCGAMTLLRKEAVVPMPQVKECSAYATAMSVVVESFGTEIARSHQRVAWGEIRLVDRRTKRYKAWFEESINGGRSPAFFTHHAQRLVPLNLLMRALCWSLWDQEALGPRPAPWRLPDADSTGAVDLFAVPQPARGGFVRWLETHYPDEMEATEATARAPIQRLRAFLRGERPAYADSRA